MAAERQSLTLCINLGKVSDHNFTFNVPHERPSEPITMEEHQPFQMLLQHCHSLRSLQHQWLPEK